tara:strand:+ start:1137 stop:1406 length:270 start_codon:yes stop_codon:yes gene_type:complete
MNEEPWRPKPGALVQIWDHSAEKEPAELPIVGHGEVGYVVRRSSMELTPDGPIFEVICFGESETTRHHVWHGWLREINKTSDIKKINDA